MSEQVRNAAKRVKTECRLHRELRQRRRASAMFTADLELLADYVLGTQAALQQIVEEMRTIADVADGFAGGVCSQAVRDYADRIAALWGQPSLCKCGARKDEHGPDWIWHPYEPAALGGQP